LTSAARLKIAAKQLKQTAQKHKGKTKVVILLNVGYGSLRHEEFKEIAFDRVINATKQIDCLVVGGIYFYSDRFDSYDHASHCSLTVAFSVPFG
jgi:hypothetical protein